MQMEDCKHYGGCDAPLCPLDEHYKLRKYRDGDPTCLYVREYVKNRKPQTEDEEIRYSLIEQKHEGMLEHGGTKYRHKIKAAKIAPSKRTVPELGLNPAKSVEISNPEGGSTEITVNRAILEKSQKKISVQHPNNSSANHEHVAPNSNPEIHKEEATVSH